MIEPMCNRNMHLIAGMAALSLIANVHAEELHLVGGDSLSGIVVERDNERVVLQHVVLGRVEIPSDQILAAPIATADRAPAAGADAVASEDAAPAAMQDEEPPRWKSHFELGIGSSFGNSDKQDIHFGVASHRETEWNRTALDAHYYYGAADGDRDQNRATAGITHDWLLPESPWLYFAQLRYDFDEFQSWDYRLAGHGGVGYQLIDEDDVNLTLRAGLGALKEFNSPDDNVKLEALAGFDLTWQISEKQSFEAGSTIYPDLDETGEFRTLSYVGWALSVDDETNTSVVARFVHEHQSLNPGFDKNDYRFTAGLQFDF